MQAIRLDRQMRKIITISYRRIEKDLVECS